jgi:hypothetical protein
MFGHEKLNPNGLTAILREAWSTSQHTEDRREKIQALSLAKECYL